jgi:hypothetical protein
VVEPEREVHPVDPVLAFLPISCLGSDADRPAGVPGPYENLLLPHVQQAPEHAMPAAEQAVAAGSGEPVRPGREAVPLYDHYRFNR